MRAVDGGSACRSAMQSNAKRAPSAAQARTGAAAQHGSAPVGPSHALGRPATSRAHPPLLLGWRRRPRVRRRGAGSGTRPLPADGWLAPPVLQPLPLLPPQPRPLPQPWPRRLGGCGWPPAAGGAAPAAHPLRPPPAAGGAGAGAAVARARRRAAGSPRRRWSPAAQRPAVPGCGAGAGGRSWAAWEGAGGGASRRRWRRQLSGACGALAGCRLRCRVPRRGTSRLERPREAQGCLARERRCEQIRDKRGGCPR